MRPMGILVLAIAVLVALPAHAYKPAYALYVEGPETLKPDRTLPQATPAMRNIVLRYGYREMQWVQRGPSAKDAKSGDRSPELNVRVLVFDPKDKYNRYGPVFGAFDELGREAARAAYRGLYFQGSSRANNVDARLLKTNVQESEYPLRRDGTSPGDPSRRVLSDRHFVEFIETYPASQNSHEQYTQSYLEQVANVRIEIKERWAQGATRPFPDHRSIAEEIVAKMTGRPGIAAQETEAPVSPPPQEPEATHRPELTAEPTSNGLAASTALIPATDKLPAKILLKGGKPNSTAVFHLRRDGGLLKAQGKQDRYELPVRVDARGAAEAEFFYTGGPLPAPANFEVIVMNEGKKATASVAVGLGLEFSRLRAIKGQSGVSNIYAFSLGVKSRFHPKLEIGEYLYAAEQSKAWGDMTLGIRVTPEWTNRDAGGDVAYDWTAMIKPLPGGNGLVATESAKEMKQPYYDGAKFSYPAVKLESTGKHIYRMEGTAVVIDRNGIVMNAGVAEPPMTNKAMIVMTVDANPDSYFKMLACSLDAQDSIQWLIWEGAKSIPAAGKVFDGVQTGAAILCKLTVGDYENAFYDFGNFAGGKALDGLGVRLKENPDKYSQKVHAAYKRARSAYDGAMAKKNADERDQLAKKTLEKYGLASPPPRAGDDIDPNSTATTLRGERMPAVRKPAAPSGSGSSGNSGAASGAGDELEKSLNELTKSMQGAEKDLRKLGDGLKNIFK